MKLPKILLEPDRTGWPESKQYRQNILEIWMNKLKKHYGDELPQWVDDVQLESLEERRIFEEAVEKWQARTERQKLIKQQALNREWGGKTSKYKLKAKIEKDALKKLGGFRGFEKKFKKFFEKEHRGTNVDFVSKPRGGRWGLAYIEGENIEKKMASKLKLGR